MKRARCLGGALIVIRACAPKTVQAFCAFRNGTRREGRRGKTYEREGIILLERLMRSSCSRDVAALEIAIMVDTAVQSSNSPVTEPRLFIAR